MTAPSRAAERTRWQGKTMATAESRVTIHMAASLDGFIARKDGSVDWLETSSYKSGMVELRYEVRGQAS